VANQPGPRRPFGPALWAGLVVVSLLLLTSILGRPVGVPTTGGAGWLPADGHRARFAGTAGVQASEWAIDKDMELFDGPVSFFRWLVYTKVDRRSTQLARLSTVQLAADGKAIGRSDNLFSIGDGGVRAEVVGGFDAGFRVYLPGRLDLPDGLAAGRSWMSEGTVLSFDAAGRKVPAGYRAVYSAVATTSPALRTRACVEVTMVEQIGEVTLAPTVRTWCRHTGLSAHADASGEWEETGPAASTASADTPFDWATADQLTFTPRKINGDVAAGNTVVDPVAAPGFLPDGTVVFASTVVPDVLALQADTDPPPIAWRTRPGVKNTAVATFGTTTVVAGAQRQLVAYGPAGEWLWEARLPDLAIVTPARLGDTVVVATLDGSVTAFELASGATSWRQHVASEVRTAPVVAGDRVLVVDQSGTLTCFDASGAPQWNVDAGPVEKFAVSTGPVPVVVVPNSDGPRVAGYSLADGSTLWHLRQFVDAHDVVALDGVVVLRDNDETIGIDPATGQRSWTWREERSFAGIGGGNRLLLLVDGHLVLVDNRGITVKSWPVHVDATGSPYLVASQGRVLAFSLSGVELGVTR
jgi:outer membrane protein assembly factor BamB